MCSGKGLRGEGLCGHSIYQQQGVRPTRKAGGKTHKKAATAKSLLESLGQKHAGKAGFGEGEQPASVF